MAADTRDAYLDACQDVARRGAKAPAWLVALRQRGTDSFRALGFPSPSLEDWRYTNVGPWLRSPFRAVDQARPQSLAPTGIEALPLAGLEARRLVFVDGHFSPSLSGPLEEDGGIEIVPLSRAENGAGSELGQHADPGRDGFLALNTALWSDGALVRIRRGVTASVPIQLLYVTTAGGDRIAVYPRNLILLEDGAQATVLECHVGQGEAAYLSDAVTEIVAGPASILEHVSFVLTNPLALHVGTVAVQQGRTSQVQLRSFALNRGMVRNEVSVRLAGEGAECSLDGLFAVDGKAHVDSRTTIEHVRPACTSQELYKGILAGAATGVFNGLIRVHPQAQRSVARQASKNLLLSADAQVNSKPQLEIHADDVKCNHGSTIGQIDEEALFYLRSRGLDPMAARELLTYAFASEMVSRVRCETLRSGLEREVRARLPRRAD